MNIRNFTIVFLFGLLSVFWFAGLANSAEPRGRFSDRNFRGTYAYSFEAQFTEGLGLRAVEAGVFSADGKGRLIGTGTAVTEGSGPIEATYDCTFNVMPDGRVPVECDRTTAITGTVLVKFMLVLARGSREAHFVGIPTEAPFDFLRLIGSATRQ